MQLHVLCSLAEEITGPLQVYFSFRESGKLPWYTHT